MNSNLKRSLCLFRINKGSNCKHLLAGCFGFADLVHSHHSHQLCFHQQRAADFSARETLQSTPSVAPNRNSR